MSNDETFKAIGIGSVHFKMYDEILRTLMDVWHALCVFEGESCLFRVIRCGLRKL